jgi:hypothetical protein
MEPLYASARELTELMTVVQLFKLAIDRCLSQLTTTSNWKATGTTATERCLIGALRSDSGFVQYSVSLT